MKKKAKATPITLAPSKPYRPAPHPQQTRIDAIRVIPSLVTTHSHLIPKGK
jgi:hypothetical protein